MHIAISTYLSMGYLTKKPLISKNFKSIIYAVEMTHDIIMTILIVKCFKL